ncbi:EAF family [Parasponia andersonii]|uniref:EAF family n=1 Tax=Parasponia andersonii TaxID=3476 RepID=A0A2P5BAF4_PARAD|nr:EAF family [Parasponia andersonii]
MANNTKEEPKTAPQSDRWYNLTLGPSFKDDSSAKYCTLRYEFKPASIDKSKAGSLRKTKENRVSVEFHNNQLGKPKVAFEGSSEDYKDNDAVLFFDGQTFRLERLHRAVNQLRHVRQPGESAAAAAALSGPAIEPRLSPPVAPPVSKAPKAIVVGRSAYPAVPVEVERIDIGGPDNSAGAKSASKGTADYSSELANVSTMSPEPKNDEVEEHQDIDIEDIFGATSPVAEDGNAAMEDKANPDFDMNVPHQNDTDDEIADVDDSGDEVDKGPNAAEALRAQVNAEERDEQTSSSSSSSGSGSGSSGSGSASSSSSDSEGSDEDSVNSI